MVTPACASARAVASSLLELRRPHGTDGEGPPSGVTHLGQVALGPISFSTQARPTSARPGLLRPALV